MLEAKLISEGSEKSENGVGGTPLYRIFHEEIPDGVEVLAKDESVNPTGSIKDRAAGRIIQELLEGNNRVLVSNGDEFRERKRVYRGGLIVLDSSSGNYGVSLAHFGDVYGLRVELVVPGNIPENLLQKIRDSGVDPTMTDEMEGYHGALARVRELAKDPSFLYVNQYDNLGNANAHYDGTGREIWAETDEGVTHFVAGVGTGGTLVGVARYLKERQPDVRAYSVHPDSDFPGIQGLQPFIDGRIDSNLFNANQRLVDGRFEIDHDDVTRFWRGLLHAGLQVGMSSGANLAGVIELIKMERITQGTIVTVFSDSFDRYEGMPIAPGS